MTPSSSSPTAMPLILSAATATTATPTTSTSPSTARRLLPSSRAKCRRPVAGLPPEATRLALAAPLLAETKLAPVTHLEVVTRLVLATHSVVTSRVLATRSVVTSRVLATRSEETPSAATSSSAVSRASALEAVPKHWPKLFGDPRTKSRPLGVTFMNCT